MNSPRIVMVEPDMPPNVGAVLRLGACLGLPVEVVEPCGFPFSPRAWRRQAMDYADLVALRRHDSLAAFLAGRAPGRIVALTTKGSVSLHDFRFVPGDCLMVGSESAGLPAAALEAAEARVAIPMAPGLRSLNVGMAAAIASGEACRQIGLPEAGSTGLRRGRRDELPRLQAVERAATALFATVGYDFCVGGAVRDIGELERGLDAGALFVVEDGAGVAQAFALLWIVDGHAHLAELAVAPEAQGRGLGRRLIAAAIDWARAGRFAELTLTSFRDVPWNAPFYARLGWKTVEVGPDRPGLAGVIAEEAAAGYGVRPRVAMRLRLV